MKRPLQASDTLQQSNGDNGEKLSAQDDACSVTCLHGEESGPPGIGLSALVSNSSYSDDDVSTFKYVMITNSCHPNHILLVP